MDPAKTGGPLGTHPPPENLVATSIFLGALDLLHPPPPRCPLSVGAVPFAAPLTIPARSSASRRPSSCLGAALGPAKTSSAPFLNAPLRPPTAQATVENFKGKAEGLLPPLPISRGTPEGKGGTACSLWEEPVARARRENGLSLRRGACPPNVP